MTYHFRNNRSKGLRYSVYAQRFQTDAGVMPALEWFPTMEEAFSAMDQMKADGRFSGIELYVRSQATADAEWANRR